MTENVKSMEVKKAYSTTEAKAAPATVTAAAVVDFVGEVKQEIHKINWTSPEELMVYTKLVVAMTFLLGMGIYIVDISIQSFLSVLHLLIDWL